MAVDVRTVKLRPLVFASPEEVVAEAQRLAAAGRAGRLRTLGNWTPGQIFGHLAQWVDWSFDGAPMKPPWLMRLIGPLLKPLVLKGLRQGVRLPGAPEGTYGTEVLPLEEGLARLERAMARLAASTPAIPNAVFGRMSRQEWLTLHLRHAALHLGYLVAEGDAAGG